MKKGIKRQNMKEKEENERTWQWTREEERLEGKKKKKKPKKPRYIERVKKQRLLPAAAIQRTRNEILRREPS